MVWLLNSLVYKEWKHKPNPMESTLSFSYCGADVHKYHFFWLTLLDWNIAALVVTYSFLPGGIKVH